MKTTILKIKKRIENNIVSFIIKHKDGYCIKDVNKNYRKNKRIALESVRQHGYVLKCVHKLLRGDKEVVLEAVKQNGMALRFASESLKADKEVVMEAVKQDVWAIRYVHESLRNTDFLLELSRSKSEMKTTLSLDTEKPQG